MRMACEAARRALVWPRKVVVTESRSRGWLPRLASKLKSGRPRVELGPSVDSGHARRATLRDARRTPTSDAHLGHCTRGVSAREGVAERVGPRSGIDSQHVEEGGTLKLERRDPSPWASWEEPSSSSSSRWLSCSSSTGSSRRSTDSASPLRVARAPSRLSPVASAASHRPKLRVGPGRGARRPPPDPASPVSIDAGFSTSSSAHPSSAAG